MTSRVVHDELSSSVVSGTNVGAIVGGVVGGVLGILLLGIVALVLFRRHKRQIQSTYTGVPMAVQVHQSHQVLLELGYEWSQITALMERGVIP